MGGHGHAPGAVVGGDAVSRRPRHGTVDRLDELDQLVDGDGGDADHDHAHDRDVGSVLAACGPGHAPDAGQAVDGLGGDDGGPGEPGRHAEAGEHVGQDRRQDREPQHLASTGAERSRGVDAVAANPLYAGDRGQRDRREGGTEQQPHLRGVADAEPDDQQHEVGERRKAAQEVDPRLDHRRDRSPRGDGDAKRDADDRGSQHPVGDPPHARPQVLPEVVPEVAGSAVV